MQRPSLALCEQERIPYREAFARMLALLLSQNSNN